MRWTAIAPVVLAFVSAACVTSDEPDTPAAGRASTEPAPPTVPAVSTAPGSSVPETSVTGSRPIDFGSTAATVTAADGTTCDLCLWLADTVDRRARGLMFVTDLGPADGMAFRYPRPRTGTFWMKDTVMPLSIVFYSADGDHLDAFDMEPCVTDTCESYVTPTDFLVAVEVPRGELDGLGLTPGSRLVLHDTPCVTPGT